MNEAYFLGKVMTSEKGALEVWDVGVGGGIKGKRMGEDLGCSMGWSGGKSVGGC